MKQKLITLLLLLGMAVPIVAACGMVEPPIGETTTGSVQLLETTAPNTTTSPIETTTERLPDITETTTVNSLTETTTTETANTIMLLPTVNPLESAPSVSYRKVTTLVPYEDGVAVLANREFRYFDIERANLYLICQDPTCDHTDFKTCISHFFGYNRTLSSYVTNFVYSEHDGRFYIPRGEQLYSFKTDGTDLVLEHSFGKEEDAEKERYMNMTLIELIAYQNYVYFIHKDHNKLYRFNVDTNEMEAVIDLYTGYYVLADGKLLYEHKITENNQVMEHYIAIANDDGTDAKKIDGFDMEKAFSFVTSAIYHNGLYYGVINDGGTYVATFDPKDGHIRTVAKLANDSRGLLAVTDTMIYFSESTYFFETIWCVPIDGGTAKVAFAKTSWHRDHTVYRAPHEGNSADTFRPEDIYFISEDQVVIGGVDSEYTPMYLADVKDDGTFTNIRKVEMKGDRYVSAEPIEKAEIPPAQPQVSDYLDDFVEFHYFTNGSIRQSKNIAYDNMFAGKLAIQFRVLGIDHTEEKIATYYKVQLLHVYGDDTTKYDIEKTYIVKYGGTPECPYYNRPALELGKDYLMAVSHGFEKKESISNTWIYSLSYENGKTYAYSTNYDLCGLICAEKITDPEENQIFKPDIHAKYIAAANERGLGLETYDYKCELYALLAEVWEIE